MRHHKAQAVLEFTVMFVIMMVLLFGLLRLWKKWCDHIIDRTAAANALHSGGYKTP